MLNPTPVVPCPAPPVPPIPPPGPRVPPAAEPPRPLPLEPVVPARTRSLKASGPTTNRLPTSSSTSSAPPTPLTLSSMSHDRSSSAYLVMSLVIMRPPGPLTGNRLKCSKIKERVPKAISVRNTLMLEPLSGSDVRVMLWRRVRKVHVAAQVWYVDGLLVIKVAHACGIYDKRQIENGQNYIDKLEPTG